MAPSVLFAAGSALSSTGFSLFGNRSTYVPQTPQSTGLAAEQQLEAQNTQAQVAAQQQDAQTAVSEGNLAMQQKARDIATTASGQELAYSGAGVQLNGSPLLVTNRTRILGAQEVQAMANRTAAQARLYNTNASILGNTGRAALLGENINFAGQQGRARLANLQSNSSNLPTSLNALSNVFSSTLSSNPPNWWNNFRQSNAKKQQSTTTSTP